jgi:hypothetical protein
MVFVVTTSGLQFLEMFRAPLPAPAQSYLAWISPLRLINSYGLFAVMTTTRPEIVVEGSNDGTTGALRVPLQAGRCEARAALGGAVSTAAGLADVVRRLGNARTRIAGSTTLRRG